jgi:hypothetical protein
MVQAKRLERVFRKKACEQQGILEFDNTWYNSESSALYMFTLLRIEKRQPTVIELYLLT